MKETKNKILTAALRLFAERGFKAVSVSDIAGELGITKGALYKHYKNKRDILCSIIKEMERRDSERAQSFDLPEGTFEEMPEKYRVTAIAQLCAYSRAQLRYWTEDPFAADFRKMLTVGQFGTEYGELYSQYLSAGPVGYVSDIFAALGIAQPEKAATEFYAPMFLAYSLYDAAENKQEVLKTADLLLSERQLYEIIKGD